MRILYSGLGSRKDGSAIHYAELANALEKLGVEVITASLFFLEKKSDVDTADLFPVFLNESKVMSVLKQLTPRTAKELVSPLLSVRYILQEVSRAQKMISNREPDILLVRTDCRGINLFWLSNLVARWMARRNRLPLILEVNAPLVYEHQRFFGEPSPNRWRYPFLASISERGVWQAADAIICVSSQLKDFLTQFGVSAGKVFVVPNGVDLEKFRLTVDGLAVRKKYKLEGKTVVGFVGSLKSWHGANNMVESLRLAISRKSDVRGLIVGEDASIGELIERSSLSSRIILTGNVPYGSIPEYISAMDIAVAPYPDIENFYFSPLKIFEYMAMRKPVIASGIGQIRDIIVHRHNGYLVEPGDVRELAAGIIELADNTELCREIAKNARQTIEQNYSWIKSAQAVANICETALENREKRDLLP
jgi:glycosyltransferase involved in cell wall biosynthesis